ncbi:hypothetical protein ACHWQZ_G006091 [Mnemiopsis leidyi]
MSMKSAPSQKSVVSPMEIKKIPSFDASTCPILNVVVYPDKAEITRRINVEVEEGLSQIKMTNLSKSIEPSTIRVLIGGNSILNEVNFVARSVLDEYADASGKLDELKVKQAELLKELSDLEVKENTLKKQKEVLEAFANRIINFKSNPQDGFDAVSVSSLDMIAKFLPMYEEQSVKICDSLSDVKEQRLSLDKKLKEVTDEINATDPAKDGIVSREVQILIEAYNSEDVKLFVSYVVNDAGWVPKYDLRVHSRDKNLKVLYFGLVSQNTGEDWNDAKISLSTASPSTGGLPFLGTHELHSRPAAMPGTPSLKRTRHHGTSIKRKKSGSKDYWRQCSAPSTSTDRHTDRNRMYMTIDRQYPSPYRGCNDSLNRRSSESLHEKTVRIPTTESSTIEDDTNDTVTTPKVNGIDAGSDENLIVDFKDMGLEDVIPVESRPAIISTTYGAAMEEVNVPSDKTGHKVNIAKIDLPAAFFYASCPRVCPHAFLRITARNDSAYALLAGNADIFLDGNFCSKGHMKDVCPTEEFEVDVGSDPTIKVAYRPLIRHKETTNKTHVITYTQDMDLKNGRKEPVNVVVTDQLPKSNDDKVKVSNFINPTQKTFL